MKEVMKVMKESTSTVKFHACEGNSGRKAGKWIKRKMIEGEWNLDMKLSDSTQKIKQHEGEIATSNS